MATKTGNPVRTESQVPLITELERFLVRIYSTQTGDRDSKRPKVTVTIQTRGHRKNCLGHFSPGQWSTKEGVPVHEIMVSAERLDREPMEILGTLAHETAHLWNNDMGIKDCAEIGRHNKKFAEAAEMLGMEVESSKSGGMNQTTLTPEMMQRIEKEFKPDIEAFNMFRQVFEKEKKEPSMVKWQCSEGCTIVRASKKVEVQADCEICGERFKRSE